MDSYPRETVEFVPVTITVDGVAVTSGVQFCVIPAYDGDRPTVWSAATVLGNRIGFMTNTLTATKFPATFRVWAQVTDSPEVPVIDCGTLQLT